MRAMFQISLLAVFVSALFASDPITVDGLFDDWTSIPAVTDPNGDGFDEDFSMLKITNDDRFLFLLVELNQEILLQDFNNIRLFIDSDNNAETGFAFGGLGAEIEWCFGCRSGFIHEASASNPIQQNNLTLRSAPTISSRSFEIAISHQNPPFDISAQDTIAVAFVTSDFSDQLPDENGGLRYIIDSTPVPPPDPIPLSRNQTEHLRIMTYNTLSSGLLDPARQPRFERIIKALAPDIVGLQEQGGAGQVADLVANWLQDSNFEAVQLGNNNIVLSRFPIEFSAILTSSGRTMAALLDTRASIGEKLLLLNSHLSCCANDFSRQQDSDELIKVLRDWRNGSGPFPVSNGTPIIHLGDFNLIGFSQQLRTLTTGDIQNEFQFGPDFRPDWDGSALIDLFSRQTAIRMGYTWRNDFSEFSPGKLDYILYSDSVIELGNHYVLNTLAMSPADLNTYGLQADDTNLASDHLPRIMDIARILPLSVENNVAGETPASFRLYEAYPNPFNASTTVEFELKQGANVTLTVFDVTGRTVAILESGLMEKGVHRTTFEAGGFASGVYLIRLKTGSFQQAVKVLLIK